MGRRCGTARLDVVVVDDHPLLRSGVARLLRRNGSRVVGEAGDAASAAELVERTRPRLVLMDIDIPGDGVTATRRARAACPDVLILGYTGMRSSDRVTAMYAAGANVVLSKSAPAEAILAAVEGLHVRGRVDEACHPWVLTPDSPGPAAELSAQERRVVALVARGMTSRQIAQELGIAVATVAKHRENACRKVGVSGASGLLRWALGAGGAAGE